MTKPDFADLGIFVLTVLTAAVIGALAAGVVARGCQVIAAYDLGKDEQP